MQNTLYAKMLVTSTALHHTCITNKFAYRMCVDHQALLLRSKNYYIIHKLLKVIKYIYVSLTTLQVV
jgi:hypothetical protein